MNREETIGWCPSTLVPMMSGDGLLVRIKPAFGRLTNRQARKLALLSKRHGNGFMDITNRANLQIRGIKQANYPAMLEDLQDSGIAGLNKACDDLNLIFSPLTARLSLGWRCAEALYNVASEFPPLPPKFGFTIDCEAESYLHHAAADIRIEIDKTDRLMIRFDGCKQGFGTSEEKFQSDILRSLDWFVSSKNNKSRCNRMHQLVTNSDVPDIFTTNMPCRNIRSLHPGPKKNWQVVAVPFGQMTADQLLEIADQTLEIMFSINRCLIIDRTARLDQQFITSKDDPRYNVTACAGMPACTSASIGTKQLASNLCENSAILAGKSYHISGCKKGCAKPTSSDICIIGESGSYNLLENGCAWDKPSFMSLSETVLINKLINLQKAKKMLFNYEKNGAAIYKESFATIRSEADLSSFTLEEEIIAVRMIHASGLVELANSIKFSPEFATVARAAIEKGAPILCDTKMVSEGITRTRLPKNNKIICTLQDPSVKSMAIKTGNTRSAVAIELWRSYLEGAVIAIGNAPTALFHLLNLLQDPDYPRPAAIIGCPVGFVGALESKEALMLSAPVPYCITTGRIGGSAITVAAINALASRIE